MAGGGKNPGSEEKSLVQRKKPWFRGEKSGSEQCIFLIFANLQWGRYLGESIEDILEVFNSKKPWFGGPNHLKKGKNTLFRIFAILTTSS